MPPKKPSKQALKRAGSKGQSSGDDLTGLDVVEVDDGGRVAAGTLLSDPRARDIKISNFSLSIHRTTIVEDTQLDFRKGGRYGLLGRNGCGKSTLLRCLAAREIPIPLTFDIYLLAGEATPSDITALEYFIAPARLEIVRLIAGIDI